MKAELCREISHRPGEARRWLAMPPCFAARHIGVEFLHHSTHLAEEVVVLREFLQSPLFAKLQRAHRVVICSVPHLRIEMTK